MRRFPTIVLLLVIVSSQFSHSISGQSGRSRQAPRPPTVQITQRPSAPSGQIPPPEPKQKSNLAAELIAGRELKGGEVHYYPFPMAAGQFCTINVQQRGIDVVLTLIAPDGKRHPEVDSPNGSLGTESLALIAKTSGEYQLQIRPLEDAAEPGRYDVRITERRPANRQDRINDLAVRIAAAETESESDSILSIESELGGIELGRAIFEEGHRLLRPNVPPARVLKVFQRLLRLSARRDMGGAAAMGYRGIGVTYRFMQQYDLAEENLLKAISLLRRMNFLPGLAWANFEIGTVHGAKGEPARAIEHYKQSLYTYEELGDFERAVRAQNQIASAYVSLRDFPKAYDHLERSVRLAKTLSDPKVKLFTFGILASTYNAQGRAAKSLETLQAAYKLAEETNSVSDMAAFAYSIGLTHQGQGNVGPAYASYRRAIALLESTGNLPRATQAQFQIATLYRSLGRHQKAIETYERVLRTIDSQIERNSGWAKSGIIYDKADVLNRLGRTKQDQGNLVAALAVLDQSLVLLDSTRRDRESDRSSDIRERAMRIETHRTIGEVHSAGGDYAAAHSQFQKALALSDSPGHRRNSIEILMSIAGNATKQRDFRYALEVTTRAYQIVEKDGRLDQIARIKTSIGATQRKLNRPEAAGEAFADATKIIESLRIDVTSPNERASYFASLQAPYDEYIDFLMELHAKDPSMGHDRTAFDISERRRSRALLDSLKEARADIRRGVDVSLIEQENEVRNRLNTAARARDPFAEVATLDYSAMEDMGPPPAADADIPALTAELQLIETAIRAQSPRYSALTQPQPLKAAEIETSILDDETILLNYTLGEKRSFLWAISKGATTSYVLPSRAEIEASVKKVYAHLRDGDLAGNAKSTDEFELEAAKLSRTLLAPVASKLGSKRLVIVADGVLQYLPFSTLPDPRAAELNRMPMLASNEIIFAPSASVVGVLRHDLGNRAAAAKSVAIFADPVFSDSDERISPGKTDQTASTNRGLDDTRVSRGLLFPTLIDPEIPGEQFSVPRLPFSRREADAVETVAPNGTALKAVDFAASRENVLNSDFSKYRIIHFATHGILHSEYPELSGVVLSLVNENGGPVNGFLRLNEIYNLNLHADLVVLSACQTALGKEIRGEGLIGLARGFMYAGSPRVVASLWKVDDVATAELMKVFYHKMLKENMRPAAALRAAKIEIWKSKRWNTPYYWAAFELQGEWR